ncbi:signal peptidase II [Halovulum sp. GXIMD14793]
MRLIAFSALIILVLDRLSKLYVLEVLTLDVLKRVEVVPPYLNFVMAWNKGVNFGLGGNDSEFTRWFLVGLALVICIGLLVWGLRTQGVKVPLSIGLVVGGALGNVWDRIQYGAVADFLNMSCCGINNPFSFNVADVAIFLGAVGLIMFAGKTENKA